LATGKVLFQSQEVAFVVAEDQYTAADAAELVEVEYEELPVLVDPHKALDPDAPILRNDREQKTNHIFHWEVGDRQATDKAFENAEVKAQLHAVFQRCHPAPLETCGCVADFNTPRHRTPRSTSLRLRTRTALYLPSWAASRKQHPRHLPDIGGVSATSSDLSGYVCAVLRL
jgi:carbon-monoxide dehydrogenase large subunit